LISLDYAKNKMGKEQKARGEASIDSAQTHHSDSIYQAIKAKKACFRSIRTNSLCNQR